MPPPKPPSCTHVRGGEERSFGGHLCDAGGPHLFHSTAEVVVGAGADNNQLPRLLEAKNTATLHQQEAKNTATLHTAVEKLRMRLERPTLQIVDPMATSAVGLHSLHLPNEDDTCSSGTLRIRSVAARCSSSTTEDSPTTQQCPLRRALSFSRRFSASQTNPDDDDSLDITRHAGRPVRAVPGYKMNPACGGDDGSDTVSLTLMSALLRAEDGELYGSSEVRNPSAARRKSQRRSACATW